MSLFTPSLINSDVDASTGDRYSLINGIMRKGIMARLERNRYLSRLVTNETIRPGQMFEEWLRYARIGSEYHDLGTEIMPQETKIKRYRIFQDERPLVTSHAVDDWEAFVSNIPHQQQLAMIMADELDHQREIETIKQIILAARDTGDITESQEFRGGGLNGYGRSLGLGDGTAITASGILGLLDLIDENWFNIGSRGTEAYCLVDSTYWYDLRDSDGVFVVGKEGTNSQTSAFYNPSMGYMAGPSPMTMAGAEAELVYKGIRIIRSNVAKEVFGKDRSNDRYRQGDFGSRGSADQTVDTAIETSTAAGTTASQTIATTFGVVWKPDAVAMVNASSPKFEQERRVSRQITQTVGSMLMGGGSLYAENAIELVSHT